MAWENNGFTLPALAASVIRAGEPVALVGALNAASARDEVVIPAGSTNMDVLGVARATQASVGYPVEVVTDGVVKCLAGASLGAGARVGVGSTNGQLAPLALGAVASQVKFQVGRALDSAVAGDIFSVLLEPQQIV